MLTAIWSGVALSVFLLYLALTLPDLNKVLNETRKPTVTLLDRHGERIAAINDLYSEPVDVERLPPHVWQAVIAIEDRRFFRHYGLDPRGFARALHRNVIGSRREGGSTITQQLSKNLFLTREQTISRKLRELMLTAWLEQKLSKEQILSLYLNRVSLVRGRFGISAAAEELFGKTAGQLNIAESAYIAAMLKAPSRFNPAINPEPAWARARLVLSQMFAQGFITETQYREALSYRYSGHRSEGNQTRYFIDAVLMELPSRVPELRSDVFVRTTLDLRAQRSAENIVRSFIDTRGTRFAFSEAAGVFMDLNGGIIAMVGGRDYAVSQFNRATQMRRQPGSAFKPFVFLAGLSKGMSPNDMFDDKPTTIAGWTPRNHDDRYMGPVSMQDALALSLNTVAVQVALKVGLPTVISTARGLGLIDRITNDFTIVLGTSEVSLLDLTAAYGVFARRGEGIIPHTISSVETKGGEMLFRRSGSGAPRVLSAAEAEAMDDMLRLAVDSGTGRGARIEGARIAGKTGTSNDNRDAWFVGYSPTFVGGVWVGNDDGSPMSRDSFGGTIPTQIFRAIASFILTL
jgi:penicillin-binding protein 1A